MLFEEITTGFEGIYEVSEAARYLLIDMRQPDIRHMMRTRHLIPWIHGGCHTQLWWTFQAGSFFLRSKI